MGHKKWMSLLGLANRARKVVSGEELVIKEVRSGRAKLVILSRDASHNTAKKIQDKCSYYGVRIHFVDKRELLGRAIGKDSRVVVAVLEEGFANKMANLLHD